MRIRAKSVGISDVFVVFVVVVVVVAQIIIIWDLVGICVICHLMNDAVHKSRPVVTNTNLLSAVQYHQPQHDYGTKQGASLKNTAQPLPCHVLSDNQSFLIAHLVPIPYQ